MFASKCHSAGSVLTLALLPHLTEVLDREGGSLWATFMNLLNDFVTSASQAGESASQTGRAYDVTHSGEPSEQRPCSNAQVFNQVSNVPKLIFHCGIMTSPFRMLQTIKTKTQPLGCSPIVLLEVAF